MTARTSDLPATAPAATAPATTAGALGRLAAAVRHAAGTAHAVIGPVRDLVSPLGRLVATMTLVTGVLGVRAGWSETWVIALLGALCLLLAVGFVAGRSTYRATIGFETLRAVVGSRAIAEVVIENAGGRRLRPQRIEVAIGEGYVAFDLPSLAAGERHDELVDVPTGRRGVIAVGPVSSVREDPLRLMRREVRWTSPTDFYVHPRTVALSGAATGFLRDIEGVATQDLSSSDVSFHALREFTPGDDRRFVHWPTTMRTGTLMIRQFEETRRSHLVVVLSTDPGHYTDDGEFEDALSMAASLALQALREERQVSFFAGLRRIATPTPTHFLDASCHVRLGGPVTPVRTLTRAAVAAVPVASVIALVGGAGIDAADWHSASVEIPVDLLRFAVAAVSTGETSLRPLGDLSVLEVAGLDDLPRAMHRIAV